MKLLLFLVAVVALCWYFLTASPPVLPSPVAAAPAPVSVPPKSAPTIAVAPPIAPPPPAPVTAVAQPAEVAPAESPQIVLDDVLGPNNLYHDDLLGVSATLPDGWKVRSAQRWGTNNRENTVFMETDAAAAPSMYYQMYPKEVPERGATEAYLRNIAQWKEGSRISGGLTDYKNVPESFSFKEIDGRSTLSYFATFTAGDQVMTEYFVRILGQKGYVMFFTKGKLEDVKAIMPPVEKMAASVKVP